MQQTLYSLYGTTNIALTYTDDDNMKHYIRNDQDLINAYEALKEKINLKFIVEDQENEGPDDVFARIDFLRQSIADVSSLKQDFKVTRDEDVKEAYSAPMIINETLQAASPLIETTKYKHHTDTESPVVFQNTKCNCCSIEPITGVLYKCTVCSSINLCQNCENLNIHTHPLVKYRNEIISENLNLFPIKQLAREFGKEIGKILNKNTAKYSVEVLRCPDADISNFNQKITKTWEIKNTGTDAWPANTKIVFNKGSLLHIHSENICILPGDSTSVSITFLTPSTEGNHKSTWSLQIKPYKFIGKMTAKIKVIDIPDSRIDDLKNFLKMGMTIERAILSLT